MSENMRIYEKVRNVPNEALRAIQGGRLKGMSDINPMWRIKMLTESFGICGIGWKVEITDKRLERGDGVEIVCFVDINLYVKVDGEWSEPIPGMGGSSFVTQERNGPFTSDECFKMAYTDAISVACKSLGFAANVYFEKDRTKYSQQEDVVQASQTPVQTPQQQPKAATDQTVADDLAAIERASGDLAGGPNYITEGQSRMLFAKWKQTQYANIPQKDVCELISAHLAKHVEDFKKVEKADVNKVIKWLDDHKAA